MSPYVVTAKRFAPCMVCDDPTCTHKSEDLFERVVATVEAARQTVFGIAEDAGCDVALCVQASRAVSVNGGPVAILPDETHIAVRRERWVDLAACANVVWVDTPECRAEVLAAFNSQGVVA